NIPIGPKYHDSEFTRDIDPGPSRRASTEVVVSFSRASPSRTDDKTSDAHWPNLAAAAALQQSRSPNLRHADFISGTPRAGSPLLPFVATCPQRSRFTG